MAELQNKVPELLAKKGWDKRTFAAQCFSAGLSIDTAYRVFDGETDVRTTTLAVIADVLNVTSISQLIDIVPKQ